VNVPQLGLAAATSAVLVDGGRSAG
jgi:hypothetical protein